MDRLRSRGALTAILLATSACAPPGPTTATSPTSPPPLASEAPTSSPAALPSGNPSPTPCVPPDTSILASPPAVKPTPQSGRFELGTLYREGLIYIKLVACKDIDEVLARYGLPRPAYHLPSPTDPIALAIGSDRQYHVTIPLGTERKEVERLGAQRADFDFVGVVAEAVLCVVECPPRPLVTPSTGPRGTAFQLRFCCWRRGTAVEKIFTTPDGRTIRLSDVSKEDGTVIAGWGSGPSDALGAYEVKVRGDSIAQMLSFTIE